MKIDFVLTSSNISGHYLELYPHIFDVWKQLFGLDCYLVLVAEEIPAELEEYSAYILLFPPIEEVNSIFVAQTVRVLYPCLYPDKNILITDVDIFPVSTDYFLRPITDLAENKFISYRDKYLKQKMLAVCYNLAKGSTYREIFKSSTLSEIRDLIQTWYQPYKDKYDGTKNCPGWFTDQKKLFEYCQRFSDSSEKNQRLVILKDSETGFKRLDKRERNYIRANFSEVLEKFSHRAAWTDFHCIKPYSKLKRQIIQIKDQIIQANRPNVAICFSGAIRSFDSCITATYLHFLSQFNADIFLHMWEIDEIDSDLDVTFKMRRSNADKERILDILKPKRYIIDEYNAKWEQTILEGIGMQKVEFPDLKTNNYARNAMGMYYKIYQSNKLCSEYAEETGTEYDFVFRARLDYIFEDYIGLRDILPIRKNTVYLIRDRYATASRLNTNDKFFGGAPEVIEKMSEIYKDISAYYAAGKQIEGQTLCQEQIQKHGFDVCMIGHEFTYYKCQGRHELTYKKTATINITNQFRFGLAYNLLHNGYRVVGKSPYRFRSVLQFSQAYSETAEQEISDSIEFEEQPWNGESPTSTDNLRIYHMIIEGKLPPSTPKVGDTVKYRIPDRGYYTDRVFAIKGDKYIMNNKVTITDKNIIAVI